MNENETRQKLINKVLHQKEWNQLVSTEVSFNTHQNNTFSTGRMDYVLHDPVNKNNILAVIEAKPVKIYAETGLDQARMYAKANHIPYAIATNGKVFDLYNTKTQCNLKDSMDNFPTPNQLKYPSYNINKLNKILHLPYMNIDNKIPRYYQKEAINNVFEGIMTGRKHMLLAMATGSGKTYVASQIVHRAFEATDKHLMHPINHVLYLADRTNLLKQPLAKDFHIYQEKGMAHYYNKHQLLEHSLSKGKSILMESYQMFYGTYLFRPYKAFKKDAIDLIIVDEAHRGSAKITSNWHKILNHFPNSIVIGMTATPKETLDANQGYYGYPIYSYPLTKGIHDGYLAPYHLEECHMTTKYNYVNYNNTQLNSMVVKKLMNIERKHNHAKAIVFCQNIRHAHQLEQNVLNYGYKSVDSFTSKERRKFKHGLLLKFENSNSDPAIAITSKLMSTGIDVPSLRYIILDKHFNSKIELEQVIGRGTRKCKGKQIFTIIDYGNNSYMLTHIPSLKYSNVKYNKDILKALKKQDNHKKNQSHKKHKVPTIVLSTKNTHSSESHNGEYLKDDDIYNWRKQMHEKWSTSYDFLKYLITYVIDSGDTFYSKLFKQGYITCPEYKKMQINNHDKRIDALVYLLNKYYDLPLVSKGYIVYVINNYKTNDSTMKQLIKFINNTYINRNSLIDYASFGLINENNCSYSDAMDWLQNNEHSMNQYIENISTLIVYVLVSLQKMHNKSVYNIDTDKQDN